MRQFRCAPSPAKVLTACAAAILILLPAARAQTETWDFDLQTSGEDAYWTSDTAVDNAAELYHGAYEITLVEVTVSYSGITFDPIDVTDQINEEDRVGEDRYPGPPPFTVYDDHVRYPDEPEPVSFEADFLMYVDADGYGQASLTNVVLGTVTVDLGFPFGEVEAQVEAVRFVGTMWVTPLVIGDVDGDGDVDLSDLGLLLDSYGACDADADYNSYADFNFDGCVDLADLGALLANYGYGT